MDLQDLLLTAVRATLVYFFILLIIRLLGKRSIGITSAFDLLVALMLGEMVDEIIFGDVTLAKGFTAISVVAIWHFANEWASSRSQKIDRLTGGKPVVLMEHGQFNDDHLASERLNREEVLSHQRLEGIAETQDVKRATLEPSGRISFIKEEAAETVQKRDLPRLKGSR